MACTTPPFSSAEGSSSCAEDPLSARAILCPAAAFLWSYQEALRSSTSDFFQIFTRTNAVPSGAYNELSDGISFYIGTGEWGTDDTPQMTLCIKPKGSSSDQAVAASSSMWRPEVGVAYSFRIVDASSHAHLYIDNRLLLVHSHLPTTYSPGSYVALYNRETHAAQTSFGPITISTLPSLSGPLPTRPPSPLAPAPTPVQAQAGWSVTAPSDSSGASPGAVAGAVVGVILLVLVSAVAVMKVIQRRKRAAEVEVRLLLSSSSQWANFISKLDTDARAFASKHWDGSVCRSCGNVVHTELNPFLDAESPLVVNFKNGITECGHADGRFLWHGTAADSIVPICQGGFNPELRRNCVHGLGEYFGRSPSTSHTYAREDKNHLRRLILCYVLKESGGDGGDIVFVENPPLSHNRTFVLPVLVVTYSLRATNPPLNCVFESLFGSTRILYHQTHDAAAHAIMAGGFDMSTACAGLAGRGIYFATHPRSTFHKSNHRGSIIRVRVNVGLSFPDTFQPATTDFDQTLRPYGYLSVRIPRNDWNKNPTENGAEYVIYNAVQAQPRAIMSSSQFAQVQHCTV